MGGKRLTDFFIGGEDGAVVADKIMQAGTQGTEDCVFVVMSGCFVIIALPGGKVGPNRFGFPIILEEGGDLAGIILLPGLGTSFHFMQFFGRGFNRHPWPERIHPTGQRR